MAGNQQFGHAFVGFKVTYDNGETKELIIGFYGSDNINPLQDVYSGKGQVQDDQDHRANSFISKEVGFDGFNAALERIASEADEGIYHINDNNCTNVALECFNLAGGEEIMSEARELKTELPFGEVDFGEALMPGQLGEDIEESGGTTKSDYFDPDGMKNGEEIKDDSSSASSGDDDSSSSSGGS